MPRLSVLRIVTPFDVALLRCIPDIIESDPDWNRVWPVRKDHDTSWFSSPMDLVVLAAWDVAQANPDKGVSDFLAWMSTRDNVRGNLRSHHWMYRHFSPKVEELARMLVRRIRTDALGIYTSVRGTDAHYYFGNFPKSPMETYASRQDLLVFGERVARRYREITRTADNAWDPYKRWFEAATPV